MAASDVNKALARKIAGAFGGKPSVSRFHDDAKASFVDILTCADRPQDGVNSYSTLLLSDHPLYKQGRDTGIQIALVGACEAGRDQFRNVLATAAFCVVNSRWFCAPGIIFPDVVGSYFKEGALKHLLFVSPFLWDNLLTIDLQERKVSFLQVVPIAEAEMRFAEKKGPDALEDMFEKEQIDVFDLERESVV